MKIGVSVAKSKVQLYVNQAYVNYVMSAGMEPILINDHNDPQGMAALCDGLLLPGGNDIDPLYYGEDNYSSSSTKPDRDEFERQLLTAFMQEGKKVFGICRGFQLMVLEYLKANAAANKRLSFEQHISGHNQASLDLERSQPVHKVVADLNALYAADNDVYKYLSVNSMHHQGLILMNENMITSVEGMNLLAFTKYGMSKKDKGFIVEAIDIPQWNCRGVQWHPEELMDTALLNTYFGGNNAKVAGA